jgi:hypothetical protein
MIPNKELQELTQAIKRSSEYAEMSNLRKRVMEHPRYGRQMYFFERENARLYGMGLPEAELTVRLKKLYTEFKGLLEVEEVKKYMESTRVYQKMIVESITYLNRSLEFNRVY